MRIVIVGQQAFGKAVLEAFMARGDQVAGVFAAPERPGARPDPLVVAAQERGLTVHRHAKYSSDEAKQALAELNADLGVMAYVLLFAPPEFCAIPKHGMIQFHPSLLPLHRGPSSIPWAIIRGRSETGLSIFRPTPGLDEGPVILQKRVPIGPDETAGSLYFDKIFPLGVEALVQAADLVVSGRATETTQDESRATYEGWVREAESRINWASPCRLRLRPDPRLQPGAGRLDHGRGAQALPVRCAQDHRPDLWRGPRTQDRRGRLGRRGGHADPRPGRLRRGVAGASRRWRQDRSDRRRHRRGDRARRLTPSEFVEMAVRSPILNVMGNAALKAARGLIRDFGEVEHLQVSVKGTGEFVSTADLKAERTLKAELKRARPGYAMLFEESGAEAGSDPRHRWIVDPLDGTTNFLHGIPHFAISIGLERDGEIVAGVIYEPIRDEMYWAEKGAGAYVNDRRLRVSARRQLGEAVIGTGMPFGDRADQQAYMATLAAVMGATSGVRRMGSAALDLAYVAAGRYEGFWEFALSPWDIAAGLLLVREAGGYVSDMAGGHDMMSSGDVLAANSHLHLPLAALIKEAMRAGRAAF